MEVVTLSSDEEEDPLRLDFSPKKRKTNDDFDTNMSKKAKLESDDNYEDNDEESSVKIVKVEDDVRVIPVRRKKSKTDNSNNDDDDVTAVKIVEAESDNNYEDNDEESSVKIVKVEDDVHVIPVKRRKAKTDNSSDDDDDVTAVKIVKAEDDVHIIPVKRKKLEVSDQENIESDEILVLKERLRDGRTIFNKFLEQCKSLRNEKEMDIIIRKCWKKFDTALVSYTSSPEFVELVKEKIKIVTKPRVYVHLKDIVDELLLRRKKHVKNKETKPNGVITGTKVKHVNNHIENGLKNVANGDTKLTDTKNVEDDIEFIDDNKPSGSKSNERLGKEIHINVDDVPVEHRKIVKKLRKLLVRLNRQIRKLEEAEVDWDQDDDSSYMQLERYKARFCQVHKKLCNYTNEREYLKRQKVSYSGSPYPHLNKLLEDFVNKKNQFPDFHDILKIVKEARVEKSVEKQHQLATKAFVAIGEQLQRRRKWDDWSSLSAHLDPTKSDPVEEAPELLSELKKNKEVAKKKMEDLLDEFAKQQEEKKLEAVEVAEDEAEISAGEGSGQEEEEEAKKAEEDSNDDGKEENIEDNDDDDDDTDESDDDCNKENNSEARHTSSSEAEKSDDGNPTKSNSEIEDCVKDNNLEIPDMILGPTSPPRIEEYYSPSLLKSDDEIVEEKYNIRQSRRKALNLNISKTKRSPPVIHNDDDDDDIIMLD